MPQNGRILRKTWPAAGCARWKVTW